MRHTTTVWLAALLLLPVLSAQDVHPGVKIPADSHIYLEWNSPAGAVEALCSSAPLRAAVRGGLLNSVTESSEFIRLKRLWSVLQAQLERRAAMGVRFGSAGPSIFLCAEHDGVLDLSELVRRLTELEPDLETEARGLQRGIDWFSLGKAGALGRDGRFLYWCERPSSLREMSRLKSGESMPETQIYRLARKEAGTSPFLALLDVDELVDGKTLNPNTNDPLQVLLFRGILEDLTDARFAFVSGKVGEGATLRVRLVNRKPRPESWHRAGRRWQPLPTVPRIAAHLRLDRDLADFWIRRNQLTSKSGRSALADFEKNINALLSEFPVTELMKRSGKGLDVLVREVARTEASPEIVYPEFAFNIDVSFDDKARRRFQSAFKSAIGKFNADAERDHRGLLQLAENRINEIDIIWARFESNPVTGREAPEYNFTPALLFLDQRMVLSSSFDLAADLARARNKSAKQRARRGDRLVIAGPEVERMLRLNRSALIKFWAGEQTESETKAARTVDALIETIGKMEGVRAARIALPKSTVWDLSIRVKQAEAGR